jgi:hypothetical protein
MALTLTELLEILNNSPETVEFEQVMQVIADNYQYQASAFTNGELHNQAGTNEGSCKIFAFAQIHGLSEQATLHCFGRYYREDVLQNPQGSDHGNIRNFISHGWSGIQFEKAALVQ